MNRRDVLAAAVVGGVASAQAGSGVAAETPFKLPAAEALKPLHQPFVNFERAYALMEANQVDAIVVRAPTNLYYLTGSRPLFGFETFDAGPVAVMTRRKDDRIAIILPAFGYYYQFADSRPGYDYAYYLFSGADPSGARSADGEPLAAAPSTMRDLGLVPAMPFEAYRASQLNKALAAHAASANADWALRKAIRDLGLTKARVAVDDPLLAQHLSDLEPGLTTVAGDNLVRRMRQVKTPVTVALSRDAAVANQDAALAAVRSTARPGATFRQLRAAFYSEVALRGGTPVTFLVNGISSPLYDAEIKAGDVFLIDAVSEFALYHGDYGRTISVGEPRREMKRATEAAQLGWRAVRDRLKPGLKFSEIRAIGREALRKDGYDFDVRFGPHNVGLNHNEDPYHPEQAFFVADPALEPGMVLSVDCPVLNVGMGGSAHLEDLVEITADGHKALNDLSQPVITV